MHAHFAAMTPSFKARSQLAANYSYVIFYVVKVEKIAIVKLSNRQNHYFFEHVSSVMSVHTFWYWGWYLFEICSSTSTGTSL